MKNAEIARWSDTNHTYILNRIPRAEIDEDSEDERDAYRLVGLDSGNVRRIDITIDTAYSRWRPEDITKTQILTALLSFDGTIGNGNSNLTDTIETLAEIAGVGDQWSDLRAAIIDMLREVSHTLGADDNWDAYNEEREAMGVVSIDGTEVAWWHNGAETRWMDVADLDDDERIYVGLDSAPDEDEN